MNANLNGVYIADAYFRLSREDNASAGGIPSGGGIASVGGKDKAESDSIVNQRALVQEFLKAHPDIQLYKEKVDDGFSGVSFERPAFKEMLEDIKTGRVNCVIVKDLSRFGRDYIEAGRYIEKIFPYLGVRFIAINDNIDTASGISGAEEMLIPFKNLINDAYCRDISIKIRSHLDIKRKNGQYIGSFAPYGYKKSPDDKNKLVVDEKAASVVRQIFKWKMGGMSGERIAEKLNELGIPTPMEYKHENGEHFHSGFRRKAVLKWQAYTVNYILQNEIYTGALLQGKTSSPNYKVKKRTRKEEKDWIRCEDSHEAIISKEDFLAVKEAFGVDTRVAPKEQSLYLFSGIVKCGFCGGNMTRKTVPAGGKKYVYLVCVENKNKNGCSNNKGISQQAFEKVVLKVVNLHIEKIFELSRMTQLVEGIPYNGYLSGKMQTAVTDKEMEIQGRQQLSIEAYQDYKAGVLTKEEYMELKAAFKEEINMLEHEIEVLQEEIQKTAESSKDKMQWAEQFIRYRGFEELSRELLLKLVEEIRVFDKDRIEVLFKFRSEYEELCKYRAQCGREKKDDAADILAGQTAKG